MAFKSVKNITNKIHLNFSTNSFLLDLLMILFEI